jgi:hypothetical protein
MNNLNTYTDSPYPLLAWIKNHTSMNSFCRDITYKLGDIVSYKNSIFKSTKNNNTSTPGDKYSNWIKLV